MTDFELFIQQNGIKKKDIAEYIGSSAQFITQLCNGLRRLPPEKYALLKQNSEGWDTSMLLSGDAPRISTHATGHSNASVSINSNNRQPASPAHAAALAEKDTRIAVLEKENQLLREQIEFLKTLINK